MKNIIVGTAGHIDHGKTALVKALTGIDADRLEEEKRRGITIDLGFAHGQLTPSIRAGFVDVPGHELFIKNMLAGAGGIDLVLFVIAADESIKPQTREHFDICRLLGIQSGIVVLTKRDLVDDDLLGLARLEAEEFVAGSFLEGAPIVAVSATTGEGIRELRVALESIALRLREKDALGPARLPVDRSFTLRGFGTVVTGTLISGAIQREQELDLLPNGRTVRVRGIQVYGGPADRAQAGSRTALNLADIEPGDIRRGMVLAEKGRFRVTSDFDCSLELLASAKRLKHRAPVHFHSGTVEAQAEVRLFGGGILEPGRRTFARIRLREPVVLAPGDRYIFRQFSPVITIAGGAVIDIQPSRERRIPFIDDRLKVLASLDMPAKVALLVSESAGGVSAIDLAARLGIRPVEVMSFGKSTSLVSFEPPGWLVARPWMQQQRTGLIDTVRAFHARLPLEAGIPKHELKSRCLPNTPAFLFDAVLTSTADLAIENDRVRHRTHRVQLNAQEQQARDHIEAAFRLAGLLAPAVPEVLQSIGLDAARARTVLQILLRERVLIRIDNDLIYHRETVTQIKALLSRRKSEAFTVANFKEWTGISRKFAIPLLEFLDREHLTVRDGDLRRIV